MKLLFPSFFACVLTTFSCMAKDVLSTSQDILAFYQKMENKPVWFFQGSLTKCGHMAIEVLQNAAQEGLNPRDYEDAAQALTPSKKWIEAEILLTQRFLEYIDHLRKGRIDPQRISRNIKFHGHKVRPVEWLLHVFQNSNGDCSKLRDMAPSHPQYQRLRDVLEYYRTLARETPEWPKITSTKPLKLGDNNPDILVLRQLLNLHGDLENDIPSSKLDREVDAALRQFQRRHMLEADGLVGGKTKEALNRPIDELIVKTLINMERLRWLPDNLGDKHIIVNVAGYQVQAFERAEAKLTIPAIVGRPSRRTPLFYADLKNVVINPSWGVPYNILVHDKLPKIIQDPDYVRRSGFTVTDSSGNIIDPDQADWENEGASYHLRQSPGRHNALGQVKFNIENPYTIYMHGTPEEKLFQKTARAFSSGCIRLKNPIELAVWVLNDENKWSTDHIQQSIHKGGTQTIIPDRVIPVYFTYQTIWLGDGDLIYMSDDPYRMDPKMAKVLHPKA